MMTTILKSVDEIATKDMTPLMRQYTRAKESVPDAILMLRVGDFYEMFFEDATLAASILQISLTTFTVHNAGKVPICGIPYRVVGEYITKLEDAGKTVATADPVVEGG